MTYQGARARELLQDPTSVVAVSEVRIDADGRVSDVLSGIMDKRSNHWVSPVLRSPVSEVVEAIHNGDQVLALFPGDDGRTPEFEATEFDDGVETIELMASDGRSSELSDMIQLSD